jgi:N-acetylglutamate synthase-like GNAT family acetyltransferase
VKIRDARDADLAAIARVAERSDLLIGDLNAGNFPSMLTWLYVDPPPKIRLQFVAEHEDAVVAHYGAVPLAYKLFDETCMAGFASTLVIDRDHRAGMLFFSLQSYLQREYRKRNMRFVYGLITRANVLEPHLRTGWKKIGTVPVYAKPFNFPVVAASVLKHPLLRALAYVPLKVAQLLWRTYWSRRTSRIAVEESSQFGTDADAFLEAFMASRQVTALRTREILNWRFAGYPERAYRIFVAREAGRVVGYAVTRCMPLKHLRALAVVDIAFDPAHEAVGKALLHCCDAEAIRLRVDVAAAIMNPSSPFAAYLRRSGFLKTPESFTLVVHAPRDVPGAAFTEELFPSWHLTWFEHDYV